MTERTYGAAMSALGTVKREEEAEEVYELSSSSTNSEEPRDGEDEAGNRGSSQGSPGCEGLVQKKRRVVHPQDPQANSWGYEDLQNPIGHDAPPPVARPFFPQPSVDESARTRANCKQFWKAGDYEGQPASALQQLGGIDHVRVHPKFLHSNATSHRWALGALAELVDNAVDEVLNGATFCNVDVCSLPKTGTPALVIEGPLLCHVTPLPQPTWTIYVGPKLAAHSQPDLRATELVSFINLPFIIHLFIHPFHQAACRGKFLHFREYNSSSELFLPQLWSWKRDAPPVRRIPNIRNLPSASRRGCALWNHRHSIELNRRHSPLGRLVQAMEKGTKLIDDPSDKSREKISFRIIRQVSKGESGGESASKKQKKAAQVKKRTNLVAKFGKGMGIGSVDRISSSQTRRILQNLNGQNVTIRPLGPAQTDMPDSQGPSIVVQCSDEENEYSKLMKRMQRMEDDMKRREANMEDNMKRREADMEKNIKYINFFLEDGHELSVRAFLDKILHSLYVAAGTAAMSNAEKSAWLKSSNADAFITMNENCWLPLKDLRGATGLVLTLDLLRRLRYAKYVSSELSAATCHSSKPIKVAIALQQLQEFKANENILSLFRDSFKMNVEEMIKLYEEGKGEHFCTTFSVQN